MGEGIDLICPWKTTRPHKHVALLPVLKSLRGYGAGSNNSWYQEIPLEGREEGREGGREGGGGEERGREG
ncbi:hypothetical protein L345_08878, partial [Ophiophagus hannah]